jgi:hypothetical protein
MRFGGDTGASNAYQYIINSRNLFFSQRRQERKEIHFMFLKTIGYIFAIFAS